MKILILIFSLISAIGLANASEPDAQLIVTRSDQVRNPRVPFQVGTRLTEYVDGSPRNKITLNILSKEDKSSGQFRNLVRYTDPPRDSGKLVLLDGTKMWFYDPASKSSVRISPQQRLVGQAAEGDVVTANLAMDYKAKLLGKESLNDADKKPRKCWHLDLTPVRDDAVYNRIEYWVEENTYHPIKGKYYSDSGRLLKIAYFHQYETHMGALRPTEVIIIDAVNSKLVTTMAFTDFKPRNVTDSWFQREFLPHFKAD